MSEKHEVSCWQCHEMTSLETRNEFDGCCWACGAEIDLEEYLIQAMDKRDEHYAARSTVTAERDSSNAKLQIARTQLEMTMRSNVQLRAEVERMTGIIGNQGARKFVGQDDQRGIDELVSLGIEQDKREIERLRAEVDGLRGLLRESYSELLAIKEAIGFRGNTIALIGRIDAAMAAKEGCDG